MNALFYRIMYSLGMARWDTQTTPPEVEQAFQTGDVPACSTIDLGCGTGTNVIYMAKQGRKATGIDFVPVAISKAREKAQQAGVFDRTQFYVADVTRLEGLDLPNCGFALDMGCFHGLSLEGQRHYAEGLAGILIPGGLYMLYTLDPRKQAGITFGVTPEQVQSVFAPWFEVDRVERGKFWDHGSTWFWMRRKR